MVTIAVQDQQAITYLSGLQAKLKNVEPDLAGIDMQLEPAVSGRFDSKTDPSGRSWAPWALATERSNPDDGNGTILGRYGDMLFPPRPRESLSLKGGEGPGQAVSPAPAGIVLAMTTH